MKHIRNITAFATFVCFALPASAASNMDVLCTKSQCDVANVPPSVPGTIYLLDGHREIENTLSQRYLLSAKTAEDGLRQWPAIQKSPEYQQLIQAAQLAGEGLRIITDLQIKTLPAFVCRSGSQIAVVYGGSYHNAATHCASWQRSIGGY